MDLLSPLEANADGALYGLGVMKIFKEQLRSSEVQRCRGFLGLLIIFRIRLAYSVVVHLLSACCFLGRDCGLNT